MGSMRIIVYIMKARKIHILQAARYYNANIHRNNNVYAGILNLILDRLRGGRKLTLYSKTKQL